MLRKFEKKNFSSTFVPLPQFSLRFLEGDPMDKGVGGGVSPQETAEQALNARLRAAEQLSSQTALLDQLKTHPQIREILEAQASGRKLKLVEDKAEETPLPDLDPVKLEEMSKADLMKLMDERLSRTMSTKLVEVVKGMLQEQLKPMGEKLGLLEQHTNKKLEEDAGVKLKEVRAKFPDFDKYNGLMQSLAARNPDLDFEDLYRKAKRIRGEEVVETKNLRSERPGGTSARAPVKLDETEKKGSPNSIFERLLRKGANRAVNLDEFEPEG